MTKIPFAGLAPDSRVVRGGGELSSFDFDRAIQVGRSLRRACETNASTENVANALADAVNAFEHDGAPACALVRIFVTRRFEELPAELQEAVCAASPGVTIEASSTCLRLIATRGIEPAWNDVAESHHHRALLLDGSSAPMIAELARQLRVDDSAAPPVATFYIPEASASPSIPATSFVSSYGVRSVFGFGTTPWPGESIAVVAFSRALIERATVRSFEIVALYGKLAWIESKNGRGLLGDTGQASASARALEEVVAWYESELRDVVLESRRRLDASRLEAKHAAEAREGDLEQHNVNLRRTQRAMLNVIEDLRDSREALASKVEERTRALATTNSELASRNRELEEFVYIASHDLQEPLRTVAGYLQMIERRYGTKLGVEADEFIHFAIEGAQRMQALIESLLLYSRVSTKEKAFELVRLDEPLDAALQNLALRISETGAIIERAQLPRVRADRVHMIQLFQNLLSNAIKFAGASAPRVHVSGQVEDGVCTLIVRDEGVGFNPRFAERIFKIFRRLRRDTPGTGVGLAVCKKIVEKHGGTIAAESSPGHGATFSVRFPADFQPGGTT